MRQRLGHLLSIAALVAGLAQASGARADDAADARAYDARIQQAQHAHLALAQSFIALFDYASAASAFARMSTQARLPAETRRDAARNAATLFAGLGDETRFAAARATLFALQPTPTDKAEIDWLAVDMDLRAWHADAPDVGDNASARASALHAVESFYAAYNGAEEAAPRVVEAAYAASMLARTRDDAAAAKWCARAVDAFEPIRAKAETDSVAPPGLLTDEVAECAYRSVDREIPTTFGAPGADTATYVGKPAVVTAAFEADLKAVKDTWVSKLDDVIRKYPSPKWTVVARVRQAGLYDVCAARLLWSRVDLPQESSYREDVDPPRRDVERTAWASAKTRLREVVESTTVKLYAEAVTWSRAFHSAPTEGRAAVARLAFYTDLVGNERISTYVSSVLDPVTRQPIPYTPDLYLLGRQSVLPAPPEGLDPLSIEAFIAR